MAVNRAVVAAFITVLYLVGYATGDSHCPDKFQVYVPSTSTCYAVITEPTKTFQQARDWCRGLSTPSDYSRPDLAVINNEDIHNALKTSLTESQAERLWIGLTETFIDWTWAPTHKALRPQGCFNKGTLSVDSLDTDMTPRLVNVTNSKCQQICEEQGYTYAGIYMVWTEAKCHCGNKFEWKFEGNMPTECNTPCPADTSEICGNNDKVLVYKIKHTSKTDLWLSSEPNNYDGYAKCLTLTSWEDRKWDDRKCGESHQTSHICQYSASGESDCSGYYYSKTRICIKLFPGSGLSWFEARSHCMRDGGDLIAIDSTELHEFIIKKTEIKDEKPATHWWIGAQSSKWTWTNGQQLSTFTNWDVSNPSKPDGHCVVIHVNSGGGSDESKKYKWEDNYCDSQYGFICETAHISTTEAATTTTTSTTTTTKPTTTTTTTTTTMLPTTPTTPTTTKSTPTTKPTTITTPTTSVVMKSKGTIPTRTRPSFFRTNPQKETTITSTTSPSTALPQPQTTPTPSPKTQPPTAASSTTTTTTTSKPASNSATPTTVKPGLMTTSNHSDINGQRTAESTNEVIFTNGVIVAIVIASVAVLVATVRLFVYCCHRRRSPSEDRRGLSP